MQKHKSLLDEMESKGLISKSEEFRGKKKVVIYRITDAWVAFSKKILQPYEAMFPRIARKSSAVIVSEAIYNDVKNCIGRVHDDEEGRIGWKREPPRDD